MVPMFTCGLVRSNFALATVGSSWCGCYLTRVAFTCAEDPWLLAADLLDDLVRDVRRHLGVRVELHRVRRLTGGLRPEVANVPEHLGQWNQRLDHPVARALVHRVDLAAPRVDVADDVAEEVLRRGD